MADATVQPKVYHKQGGDVLVVASGGEINVESGGKLTAAGTQASAIASLTDSTGGTANDTLVDLASGGTWAAGVETKVEDNFADLAAKINAILAALRGAGIIA